MGRHQVPAAWSWMTSRPMSVLATTRPHNRLPSPVSVRAPGSCPARCAAGREGSSCRDLPSLSPSGTLEHRLLSKPGMAATAGLATQDGGARQGTTEPRVALDDVSRRHEALRHRAAEQDARHRGTPLLTDRSVPDHPGGSTQSEARRMCSVARSVDLYDFARSLSLGGCGRLPGPRNGRGPGTLRHGPVCGATPCEKCCLLAPCRVRGGRS